MHENAINSKGAKGTGQIEVIDAVNVECVHYRRKGQDFHP